MKRAVAHRGRKEMDQPMPFSWTPCPTPPLPMRNPQRWRHPLERPLPPLPRISAATAELVPPPLFAVPPPLFARRTRLPPPPPPPTSIQAHVPSFSIPAPLSPIQYTPSSSAASSVRNSICSVASSTSRSSRSSRASSIASIAPPPLFSSNSFAAPTTPRAPITPVERGRSLSYTPASSSSASFTTPSPDWGVPREPVPRPSLRRRRSPTKGTLRTVRAKESEDALKLVKIREPVVVEPIRPLKLKPLTKPLRIPESEAAKKALRDKESEAALQRCYDRQTSAYLSGSLFSSSHLEALGEE